jgi:hypothetical protein
MGVSQGGLVVAAVFHLLHQAVQCRDKQLAQALAFGHDPVPVAFRQQVSPVQFDGRLQRACLDSSLELDRVQGVGDVRLPQEHLALAAQTAVAVRQSLAQEMNQISQVGARLFFGRVGPQEEGEVLARLRCASMEDQVGQQGAQARRMNGRHADAVVGQSELAQQLNPQTRRQLPPSTDPKVLAHLWTIIRPHPALVCDLCLSLGSRAGHLGVEELREKRDQTGPPSEAAGAAAQRVLHPSPPLE